LESAHDASQTVYLDEPAAASPPSFAQAASAGGGMTWGSLPGQAIAMPSSILAGTMFGRYRIESLLGEGGMGAVYRAFDTELDRTVALKLVRPELAVNPQTMKRFKQELLLASRISHKNILRIHDLGDAGGIKFITMAFVEGQDLAHLIDRTGPMPMQQALAFTRQLCAALEAAHAEGVVHRDLKPQNILVDGSDSIYVSDFGLAKSLEAEISMGTRTGQILGTPRYMSPEQVEAKDVDHRSDLYSAGLIIYEMFTAALPFRGESAMQLMYQRVSEQPRDPRRARPDLPDYIANIILKCLEKDPAKRYQSAREILNDLDAQNAPVVTNAGGQTISIQIRKPTRRGSLWALGVLAWVVALLAAIPQTRHAILGLVAGAKKAEAPKQMMAVLPMAVVGDDLKYLADGIEDALVARLGGLRDVYVADERMVIPAAAREKDDAKLAQRLGVAVLIRGTLQASGDRLSVLVKAEDVAKKQTLLNQEFTGVRQDVLALEDQVFNALTAKLTIRQTAEEVARTAIRPTLDVSAYDLYLRGSSLLRKLNAKSAEEALGMFEQATEKDRTFALAYAGISDASVYLKKPERALSAAQQAQRLNDNLPQVHYSLGTVYSKMGRSAEAISELKRAIALAPNSDEGLRRLGIAYRDAGQQEQAATAFLQASKVNPYYWNNYNLLATAYQKLGRYEDALAAIRKVVELNPDDPKGYANMGVIQYKLGLLAESIENLKKAVDLDPSVRYNLGVAYYYSGRFGDAAAAFEQGMKDAPDADFALGLGDAYRWLNQPQKAAAAYDRAIALAGESLKTSPKDTDAMLVMAQSFAQKGRLNEALQFIRQARQIDAQVSELIYREAVIHAMAKRWPEALSTLKEALEKGHPAHQALSEPDLKELREQPGFAAMLQALSKKSGK
jgi:tetratricopeptide (TPR) repeat protein